MFLTTTNILGNINLNTLTNIMNPSFAIPKLKIPDYSNKKNIKTIDLKNMNHISIIRKKISKNKLSKKELKFNKFDDLDRERVIKCKNFEIKFVKVNSF